jgi:hypothetical protein
MVRWLKDGKPYEQRRYAKVGSNSMLFKPSQNFLHFSFQQQRTTKGWWTSRAYT